MLLAHLLVFESFRGKIGDLVFKKYGDGTIVSRMPDFTNHVFTAAQIAHQEKFRQAANYGKMVLTDPQARAAYDQAAKQKHQPVMSLLITDFFKQPLVDELDLSAYEGQAGNTIAIRARDDFDVVNVTVSIKDAVTNNIIESGVALKSQTDAGRWVYTATVNVSGGTQLIIEATATDRPGHKTTKE